MKEYKRLTHYNTKTGKAVVYDYISMSAEFEPIINRLAELEDKIESGELISTKDVGNNEIEFFVKHNKEVRKETAQEILQKLYRRTRNYHGNRCLLTSKDVIDIAELYGIKLEDE